MNKAIAFITVLTFLLVAGCGKEEKKEVYSGSGGKIEVIKEKDGEVQKITIKSEEGTASMTIGKQPLPKDLGVPIYPGASREDGGTFSMSGMNEGREGNLSTTMLNSMDQFDKVLNFYKDKLSSRDPKIFEMNMPTGKMATIMVQKGEKETTSIVLIENKESGATQIQISKTVE